MPQTAAHGAWKSPITSDRIVAESVRLGSAKLSADAVYWLEGRPSEGGRSVVVRRGRGGSAEDLTPTPFNVRTRAHEYGGGAYWLDGETLYFSHDKDQRLYRLRPGGEPEALTPEEDWRFADGIVDARRGRLISIREDHSDAGKEAVNTIVAIPLEGGEPVVLAEGADFYSNPRLSPDGSALCWLEWRHPNMPWDGTELKLAAVGEDGALSDARIVAGGPAESIFQPRFSPDGVLYFMSDRSGWWNLYRVTGGEAESVIRMEAEFGNPQWVFGQSTYAFESDERAWCAFHTRAGWRLGAVDLRAKTLEEVDCPCTDISSVEAAAGRLVFLGGSATEPNAVVEMDTATREFQTLRRSARAGEELRPYLTIPEAIEFPTSEGKTAHAFYYAPKNPDFEPPAGSKPPLIVISHGGPTGQTSPTLSLRTQYWTSRGFGVVDVNYGGSTGYGREYRERLTGKWGIVDVDDCVYAAKFLVEQGRADPRKLIIRGGSAGGYTTLAALAFRDVFAAGASYYGVSDLEALATDTHKFESRYLDKLIGPYPKRKDLYEERSPIHHAEGLKAPVIFLQGAEDKVVPPDQAERMLDILRRKGLPTAYLLFDGEQHGFRQAANIKRALDAELYFYATVVLEKGLRF